MEAPIQAMMAAELGQLRVSLDASQLTATGPGLQVTRGYRIVEVVDQSATLVVTEPTGVSMRVWIDIHNDTLTFRPLDAPWNGEGKLLRVATL
jgi:hypothetical protein